MLMVLSGAQTLFLVTVLALGFSSILLYHGVSHPENNSHHQFNNAEDFHWEKIEPDRKLKWVPCYETFLQCARLKVPLDYTDPHGKSAAIAVIRIPSPLAGTAAYRGPIFFNPGGPGGSGVEFVRKIGLYLSVIVGPTFDVVGFDPRGVRYTTPRVSFFKTTAEHASWMSRDVPTLNSTDGVLPKTWAYSQIIGQLAEQRDNGALKYVTTDVVARDMLSISQAHGRDKINYWGFSYGTILGATFATMFPNNVDRLIIDGVVESEDYFRMLWSTNLRDTDKVLQTFFQECVSAGATRCPFYAPTPGAISQKLEHLLQSLREKPVPVQIESLYGVVDYSMLRTLLFASFYQPYATFPLLAKALSDLEVGDGVAALQLSALFQLPVTRKFECSCDGSSNPFSDNTFEAQLAIVCTDGVEVRDTLDESYQYYKNMARQSKWAEIWANIRISCSGWRSRAKNHFSGPLGSNTSFPILIIGNTADPVTPLWAAHKTSEKFPGSIVLTQDSPGHCSLSGPSLCTQMHIRRYLEYGTLPEVGTVCPVNRRIFPSRTAQLEDLLTDGVLDKRERDLLDAVYALSDSLRMQFPL